MTHASAHTIDWKVFSAACLLTDPHMRFEWGTKYLYLVPQEVTRDKWEAYTEVCRAFKVPYQHAEPDLRFYVTTFYRDDGPDALPYYSNMPWTHMTLGGGKGNQLPNGRPRLTHEFRRLQENVVKLCEYHDHAKIYKTGLVRGNPNYVRRRRLNELARDPFVSKWI